MYAINITTKTSKEDIYKRVAVNLYPIILFGDEEYLKEVLNFDDMKDRIKSLLRTQQLYDAAEYYIREIDEETGEVVSEKSIPVKDYTEVLYN